MGDAAACDWGGWWRVSGRGEGGGVNICWGGWIILFLNNFMTDVCQMSAGYVITASDVCQTPARHLYNQLGKWYSSK